MSYPFPPDIAKLVQDQMASGRYSSEDNLLRVALTVLSDCTDQEGEGDQEYWDTVAAVRKGLEDEAAGRMRPLEEVIAEMKLKTAEELR